MKYMLLIYNNAGFRWTGSTEDVEGLREMLEFERELQESGELIGSEALEYPEEAKIVRPGAGAPAVTDGPYAEAKEYLAGYFVIECASKERALEIATRTPRAHAVELRPIVDKVEMRQLAQP